MIDAQEKLSRAIEILKKEGKYLKYVMYLVKELAESIKDDCYLIEVAIKCPNFA
jgi:hypothetical protein